MALLKNAAGNTYSDVGLQQQTLKLRKHKRVMKPLSIWHSNLIDKVRDFSLVSEIIFLLHHGVDFAEAENETTPQQHKKVRRKWRRKGAMPPYTLE